MNTEVLNPFANSPVVAAPTGASANALMSREAADTSTAMMIARRFPRDQRAAMDRILMSCTRETLAEEGLYEYARGGTNITGPSIRLAEEMSRQWGNMVCGVAELSRHGGQSEVLAYAADLETGFRDEKRFMVRHWRDTKQGGHIITEERDIYEHLANMAARRKRACILAVIPIDVQEAAVKQCEITLNSGRGAVEPDRVKAMLEGFSGYGVTKEMIEKRIQRGLDSLTPALMTNLRKVYASLKDQMSAPGDWFEIVNTETGEIKTPAASAPKTKTEATADKLRAKAPETTTVTPVDRKKEPFYTEAGAERLLRASADEALLEKNWRDVQDDYQATNRELTNRLDAAYQETKEALAVPAEAEL